MRDQDSVDTDESGGFEAAASFSAFPTKWEGDFLELCRAAKVGEPEAIAHLWKILYQQALDAMLGEKYEDGLAEEYAAEVVDRYLLGYISPDGQVAWPGITRADQSFRLHWETTLRNFIYHKNVYRPSEDILDTGCVVYDAPEAEDEEEGDHDPPSTQTLPGTPASPGWMPGPEETYEMKELLNTFVQNLPAEARNTFRLMLEDMTEDQIAEARGLDPRTIRRHKQVIRQRAIDFFSVSHPDIVNSLLLEEKKESDV